MILRHETSGAVHWDFMFDMGELLATWQFRQDPCTLEESDVSSPLQVRRLKDHRRDYLEYQGPISGDRGHVTRVLQGEYELVDRQPGSWTFRLAGGGFRGTYQLTVMADTADMWEWRRMDQ
ncbi:MAG: hypothetical protein JSV03_01735 [Planctomycetota bacterium]|nr:MAG: hypothetical protein JSV03_01735 [Planctomycetota bacterium]